MFYWKLSKTLSGWLSSIIVGVSLLRRPAFYPIYHLSSGLLHREITSHRAGAMLVRRVRASSDSQV